MSEARRLRATPDEKTRAAMAACVIHARDLLESAKVVQASGRANIAYHLAALALEEIGRRELLGVQTIAALAIIPPSWPSKHTQDHIKKLFWCFFGGSFFSERVTAKRFEEMIGLARRVHETRLMGLYVEHGEDGLSIPSEAIKAEEAEHLIKLAAARVGMAENEKMREEVSEEDIELQAWFLNVTEDPENRRQIMSASSLAKLAELNDVPAWGRWLKEQFDTARAEGQAAAEAELARSRNLPTQGSRDKWKLRIRIRSASHSIRPKVLTAWNAKIDWIKLIPVPSKKNEFIIEFILRDNVPIEALWYFGWGLARRFVIALNIATMGFWWWRLPEQISRYYESLEDLQTRYQIALDRNPSLKIDWGDNRVLSAEDLGRVSACFVGLPGPDDQDQRPAYGYYIGGITFLSLNDVHWQCEIQAFGNFFECLRWMLQEAGDWKTGDALTPALLRFLDQLFPDMEERARFVELFDKFESGRLEGVTVTLKDASFTKLFCDFYFLHRISPIVLEKKRRQQSERATQAEHD